MFLKMLKYDMKSLYRIFLLTSPIALGVCLLGGFGFNFLVSTGDKYPLLILISVLWIMLSVFVLSAYTIIISLFVYIRFYKHLFSDEGYLTFTLPIKRSTILYSKSANAMIWTILSSIVVFIGIGLLLLPLALTSTQFLAEAFKGIFISLQNVPWNNLITTIVYIAEFGLITLTAAWFNVELTQLCITVGATITGKHKILASIGIYYAVTTVIVFATQILSFVFVVPITWLITAILSLPTPLMTIVIALILMLAAMMNAALGFVCHKISLKRIKNNLNMA